MAASRFWSSALLLSAVLLSVAAAPAAAAPRARLSADLADHLRAGTQSIDVIVHGSRATVDSLTRQYNLKLRKYLREGAVLRITAGQLAALAEDESQDHLSADVAIHSTANVTAETIAADRLWAGTGALKALTGAGVSVAVIDSGVDLRHQALKGRVLVTKDFTGGDGADRYGHGTHVAGIIAGAPGASAETSDYRGIAYGANIVNLRVLDATGAGLASDVIEAIDWAVDNRKAYNIRIINLSLGAPVLQSYRDDPLCEAVERAVAAGIVVVAAAGNSGVTSDGRTVLGSITAPGNDPNVITVGALDTHGTAVRSDDTVARFSSKGPTMYDFVLKPDLVAPGTRVVSAEAAGTYLATTYASRHVAGSGGNAYMQMSGTSMAAAVVSGTAALLLEERAKLTPRELKVALQMTSTFMPQEGLVRAGMGSVDVVAAADFVRHGVLAKQAPAGALLASRFLTITRREEALVATSGTLSAFSGADTSASWIGGRQIQGRLANTARTPSDLDKSDLFVKGLAGGDIIVWGLGSDIIVWGMGGDIIVWGMGGDIIVWGMGGDIIVWGNVSVPN
jgi:serine protease AprX